jgi:hypothetical protein
MKRTTVFAAMGAAVAAIGISIAPSAVADPTSCQQVGAATVCGQGNVRGGPQYAGPGGPSGPGPGLAGGCTNAYGAYQNCQNH